MCTGQAARAIPLFAAVCILAASALQPAGAGAAELKIGAHQLIAVNHPQSDSRLGFNVSGSGGTATYYFPVKLPAGRRFTGLKYRHSTRGAGPYGTTVNVQRVRPGSYPAWRTIIAASSSIPTVAEFAPILVTGALVPGQDPVVRSGWTYLVWVECLNANAVWDITVTYQ